MSILLSILWWLFVILGSLLLALLVTPLRARVQGRLSLEGLDGRMGFDWAFGLVSVKARAGHGARLYMLGLPIHPLLLGKKQASEKKKKGKKQQQTQKIHKTKKSSTSFGSIWQHRRSLLRALGRLLGTLHIRGQLRGRLGLEDPADTAELWGRLQAAQALSPRGFRLDVEPGFVEEELDLEGALSAWLVPIHVAGVAIALLFTKPIRQALRGLRAGAGRQV